jgi:signal transduction histidine kinase
VGIRGMRERVRQFDGELNIESNESGTKIAVTLPIRPTHPSSQEETFRSLEDAS